MEKARRRRTWIRFLARCRRSAVAVGLILYAHAALLAAVWLIAASGSPAGAIVGAMLLGAMVCLVAVAAGAVMGSRLKRDEPPIPGVADVDQQLSGAGSSFADDLEEQLRALRGDDEEVGPPGGFSPFSMTAPETRAYPDETRK